MQRRKNFKCAVIAFYTIWPYFFVMFRLVKDMVKYSKGRYGAQMCADCMKAAKKEQGNVAG